MPFLNQIHRVVCTHSRFNLTYRSFAVIKSMKLRPSRAMNLFTFTTSLGQSVPVIRVYSVQGMINACKWRSRYELATYCSVVEIFTFPVELMLCPSTSLKDWPCVGPIIGNKTLLVARVRDSSIRYRHIVGTWVNIARKIVPIKLRDDKSWFICAAFRFVSYSFATGEP